MDEPTLKEKLAEVNRQLQELREEQLLADLTYKRNRERIEELLSQKRKRVDDAGADLDAAADERAAKAARSEKSLKNREQKFQQRLEVIKGMIPPEWGVPFSTRVEAQQVNSSIVWRYPEIAIIAKYCLNGKEESKMLEQAVNDYNNKRQLEKDLWILQKERINAFWEFKIPQGWSDDQRVAFEKCRQESKQLCSSRRLNGDFVSSFCKWHDEYRSELLSDEGYTTRYVQHEWLAENPLYRVYWQWLKDGIPATV
jgi:hypothetical protein